MQQRHTEICEINGDTVQSCVVGLTCAEAEKKDRVPLLLNAGPPELPPLMAATKVNYKL